MNTWRAWRSIKSGARDVSRGMISHSSSQTRVGTGTRTSGDLMMPNAPLRACSHQPCTELVIRGVCPKHATQDNRFRGSAASRGYDRHWGRTRNAFITQRCAECGDCPSAMCMKCGGSGLSAGFCWECLAEGRMVRVDEVDHVIPWLKYPHLRLELRNLQPMCVKHHGAKSIAEQHGTALSTFQQKHRARVIELLGGI